MIPDTSIPGIYITTGKSSWNLVIHTLYQVSSEATIEMGMYQHRND